jgi:general secretion pathway protein L
MNILPQIQEAFYRWIDSVACTVNGLLHRMQPNHEVRIIEETQDTFRLRATDAGRKSCLADHRIRVANGAIKGKLPADWVQMLRGSRAEVILHANRFLFRPLELPKRAVEFLDGIVRAQIDRLTPWTPGEAVFSWTPPTDAPNDRIALTIAATARALVAPYVQAIADLGVASVVVLTVPADAGPHSAPHRGVRAAGARCVRNRPYPARARGGVPDKRARGCGNDRLFGICSRQSGRGTTGAFAKNRSATRGVAREPRIHGFGAAHA